MLDNAHCRSMCVCVYIYRERESPYYDPKYPLLQGRDSTQCLGFMVYGLSSFVDGITDS